MVHNQNNEARQGSPNSKRNFKCDVCVKTVKCLKTGKDCRRHIKRVHLNMNKPLACDFCEERFSSSNQLMKHNNLRLGKNSAISKCHYCNETFPNAYNLKKHSDIFHPSMKQKNKNKPLDTGDFSLEEWNKLVVSQTKVCPICCKIYAAPVNMRRHLREVHCSQKKYVCDVCGKQFSGTNRLRQHKQVFHLGLKRNTEKKFECYYCNKKFISKFFLKEHISTHTGNKLYVCDICKKSFGNSRGYQRHIKRHKLLSGQLKKEDLFNCPVCNKIFLEASKLKNHFGFVHGDKYNECKVCGLKIKGQISKHMLLHTGKKLHCCHICGKSFRYKLKQHMLTHSDERPHTCDVCGSSFKDKYYLKVHMRQHNGEKPYTCMICTEHFATRPSYTNHIKKHKDLFHECRICRVTFSSESKLSKHLSDHFVAGVVST